jgi:flagellar biogenesis protein FliO
MAAACVLLVGAAAQAAEADAGNSRLLPPRGSGRTMLKEGPSGAEGGQRKSAAGDGWLTTFGALTAVLALVFLTAKVMKRNAPAQQKTLPADVVQVLGRKALDYRHQIHLVRCGSRMLVLGTSQEGMRTLSEITDPVEIDYLAGLCKASEPASVGATFRQLFQKFQGSDLTTPAAPSPTPSREAGIEPVPPAESDEDPAILQLQRRLERAALGGGNAERGSATEVAG